VLNVVTGMKIMERAASTVKRLHLEPGGKAPFIVFEDADLDTAVQGAVVAGFVNPEQACTAGTRVISRSRRTNLRWLNDHLPMASEMPHGGVKKPGFGSDLSRYSFKEYTNVKHVMADLTGDVRKGWHFTVYGGQG
jgi:acyl-CoA reductase-like NAD-dependent aldehyde dehydrogenase